jgi:polyisoprenoid-binding protein YceI
MMAERYAVDPRQSRFVVKVSASGMLSALGHNPTIAIRDFIGEVRFTLDEPENASLSIKMQAGSFEVTGDMSRKDRREMQRRMHEEVLKTGNHPEIVFESAHVEAEKITDSQYRVQLQGDLSLNGTTRRERVDAQITLSGDTLRTHGEFIIRQTDYGIEPATAVGGALKLKDELQCSFDILAQKMQA